MQILRKLKKKELESAVDLIRSIIRTQDHACIIYYAPPLP